MYKSYRFQVDRTYAEQMYDDWYILSGLHGLLTPYKPIRPYDFDLNQAPDLAKQNWGYKLIGQLAANVPGLPVSAITLRARGAYLELTSKALAPFGFRGPRLAGTDLYGPLLRFVRP